MYRRGQGLSRVTGPSASDWLVWFNGGLFDDLDIIPLRNDEIRRIWDASRLDWSLVEPAIFALSSSAA